MSVWTILCEGPSVSLALRAEHPGPIVAVNRGIYMISRLPVKFWANWNRPDPQMCAARPLVPVWTSNALAPSWEEAGYEVQPGTSRERKEVDWYRGHILDVPSYTLHKAIGRCVGAGAKEIRVWGADMVGEGNVFDGWKPENTGRRSMHWNGEKSCFRDLQLELAANDIKLERVFAAPVR